MSSCSQFLPLFHACYHGDDNNTCALALTNKQKKFTTTTKTKSFGCHDDNLKAEYKDGNGDVFNCFYIKMIWDYLQRVPKLIQIMMRIHESAFIFPTHIPSLLIFFFGFLPDFLGIFSWFLPDFCGICSWFLPDFFLVFLLFDLSFDLKMMRIHCTELAFTFPTHIQHLQISSVKITKIYVFRHGEENSIRKTRKLKEIEVFQISSEHFCLRNCKTSASAVDIVQYKTSTSVVLLFRKENHYVLR